MSKKIIRADVNGDEITVRFSTEHWDLVPQAVATVVGAFIAIHKDNGYKDYEINHQLKLLITEAWEKVGYEPKDIVEEISNVEMGFSLHYGYDFYSVCFLARQG